jgi:hypothetical protein
MPWAAGSYTKGNNGTGGWVGDASLGIGIEAGRHDTQDNDFATGINQCLNKDGSNAATGNLNLGGFIPTNIAAGTAAAPAICAGNDVNTGVFGPAADTWAVATNGVERVRVDSIGNFGIGTTAPGFIVDVQSTLTNIVGTRFSADTNPSQLILRKSRGATVGTNTIVSTNDSIGGLYFQGANGTGYTDAAGILAEVDTTPGASNDMPGRLRFLTTPDGSGTPSERMRIDNAGLVGINTTALGGAAGSHLTITGSNNARAVLQTRGISGDVAEPSIDIVKFDNNSTTTQSFVEFYINNGGTGSGKITANGASAAAFGTFSDERLKENIENLPSQLANILGLRPVEFDYKNGSGHQIGFVAQEVQQIYPDNVGQDGEYLTLSDMSKNDARLIKAFQELHAKVEALEARVAELEA